MAREQIFQIRLSKFDRAALEQVAEARGGETLSSTLRQLIHAEWQRLATYQATALDRDPQQRQITGPALALLRQNFCLGGLPHRGVNDEPGR